MMQQGVSKRFGKKGEYAVVFIMVKFGQVVVVRKINTQLGLV